MMTNISLLLVAFIGGIALGIFFFGGLWLTVRMVAKAKAPAIWLIGSLLARFSITLLGFYFIGVDSWQRLLSCLVGFLGGRIIVFYVSRRWESRPAESKKEAAYET